MVLSSLYHSFSAVKTQRNCVFIASEPGLDQSEKVAVGPALNNNKTAATSTETLQERDISRLYDTYPYVIKNQRMARNPA